MPKQTFFNLPADKRENLIDIAIEEFAENDYQTASISRIVANAGIAKGSFYQYFENKEDLYGYLLELGAQQKAKFLNSKPPDPEMDIFAYLRWLVQGGIRFEFSNRKLSQIGYRAVKSGSLPDAFMEQALASANSFFKQLVAQGKAQGNIDETVDEDVAAFIFNTIFTELGGYMMERLQIEGGFSAKDGRSAFESPEAEAIFDQVLTILQSGMGVQQK